MNFLFAALILTSFLFAAGQEIFASFPPDAIRPMEALSQSIIESSKDSVTLAIGLIGVMSFFLGLMKIAEEGGALKIISKLLYPLLVKLFPEVPKDHPAMGAIILNIAANVLGLGNAATPFGIRAMQELDRLNPQKGTATNSMVLFLAINTSSVTLLPTGVIALRAAADSQDPAGIIPTTLFATTCSTLAAIFAAKTLQRFWPKPPASNPVEPSIPPEGSSVLVASEAESYPLWVGLLSIGGFISFIPLTIFYGKILAPWIIPLLTVSFFLFGWLKKVSIYEAFVEGAKEGFQVAIKIIPYLVAILSAVAMFRTSGALNFFIQPLSAWTELIGLPAEALPMALLRPLSGSGAYGLLASIIENPQLGPDSYVGYLVSTFQGSTETTFYVLAVYFGAVQIKKFRHGLATALTADAVGILSAVFICHLLWSPV
ncbi:MAG: spore maturation protein [Bdellovibrionales bacterium]|nr:spore maturation protein [Bdellovibrionales bacterium]